MVLANGEYGVMDAYKDLVKNVDLVICADGGANYAYYLGINPDYIIGDLDSITAEIREYYQLQGVKFKKYPRSKDFTDTQLALSLAEELGADDIVLVGTLGKRLDFTMSNIYAGLDMAHSGKKIKHYSPDCTIYLLTGSLRLEGCKGDLVSVLALSDQVQGVCENGFVYPLQNAVIEKTNPYAVSNVISDDRAEINLSQGILLVFHYHGNR
ncbi:thiamine diphosphokinase [Syntrophomonas palmitatica]|uniref:thiamine diphosphokinase n=1 Tax=Syntrophomonas palmitatica TaxID=402877 RepID=UPI001FA6E7D2|nr:thiamine diphosphokinase [Syntrophomonas palmitatica]